MKTELLEKLDGYRDIEQQIADSRKTGSDFRGLKGDVNKYINALHPKEVRLKVVDVQVETRSTKTIRFAAQEGSLPPFLAGQYITLMLEIDNIKTTRPYSISSSPTEKDHWDLTVRLVENGLVSNYLLDEVKVGDSFVSTGPQGHFYYNPVVHKKEMVCLAGGSGVTPFVSMIRELLAKKMERRISLIYGSNNLEEAIFHDELKALSSGSEMFEYIPIIEHPHVGYQGYRGYISAENIQSAIGSLAGKSVFMCGPQAMYDYCVEQMEILRYPKHKIRKEMYGMPVNVWQCPGWPRDVDKENKVTVSCNGEKIGECRSSDNLLIALERNHRSINSVCRSGECSMCRIKLIKGNVFQPKGTLLRKSDRKFGFIHACASYPLTDVDIAI